MASVHFPAPHAYMCFKWSYVMEDSLFVGLSYASIAELYTHRLKSPTSHSCEVLSLDLDDEDAVFTEDFIKTQHGEFIHGMTRVYETLRRMQYIEASEIRRPPHRSLPREELVTIGLEPEAIALRQHLPFLEMHDEISYGTLPYNYLNDVSDAREVLWKGEYDLTPWTVLSALVPAKSARWPNN
ncbi:hypothetical protein EAF00_001080 [Botryotinia globosa]|nr:hypothetical protein EAF00_001080 [Botryotinia globosa]